MRVLIDTDVLLDVALDRKPHSVDSAGVMRWAESEGGAAVAWHSLTNCAYLLKAGGRAFLDDLLAIVEVAPVGGADARRALALGMSDLEDAFQAAAAVAWGAEIIITRNGRHYRRSPVPAESPSAFLRRFR